MRAALVLLLVLLASCERPERDVPVAAAATRKPVAVAPDPARIDGTWDYITQSNCGVDGKGSVTFRWDPEVALYREYGDVTWPDSQLTIRWWGDARFDAKTRRLAGKMENSLGDKVDGDWRLEDVTDRWGVKAPGRLVVEWSQTNGCRGTGTATRRR